jgi:hypothetical protein
VPVGSSPARPLKVPRLRRIFGEGQRSTSAGEHDLRSGQAERVVSGAVTRHRDGHQFARYVEWGASVVPLRSMAWMGAVEVLTGAAAEPETVGLGPRLGCGSPPAVS